MFLEAVWFKNGKEVYKVSHATIIMCPNDMEDISEIEVKDKDRWHTYKDVGEADDFDAYVVEV